MERPTLRTTQIVNMSVGYLGIQFGWSLQMANMSAIYEYLGAEPHQIPILWLAAPLTGLLVQPVIGQLSDRTWCWLGRRRPYFLIGAILSSLALVWMPHATTLWMAAGALWVLDASINISMEPFRAFVADVLPEKQRVKGFAMQSLFIGLGAVIASALPWLMTNVIGVGEASTSAGAVPTTVKLSFYLGSAAFLCCVLWTIVTTREYPPADMVTFRKMRAAERGVLRLLRGVVTHVVDMPKTMRQLAAVQIFTWLGLFCMWLYFTPAIARSIFGAVNESSPEYLRGVEWGGVCFAMYSAVCFSVAFFLPRLAKRFGSRLTHSLCLLCGAAGLIAVPFVRDQYVLLLPMAGVGIAWASIVSLPYAMLASSLPAEKMGVYMGIFNFFIVLPEIVASLILGSVMMHLFGNDRMLAVVAGGCCMLIAAILMRWVKVESAASEDVATQPLGDEMTLSGA